MSRGASLNQAHVMAQLGRLLECFPRPSHAPADSAKFAEPYFDVLRGKVSVEQLTQAVTKMRSSERRFFPRPGELHWAARGEAGVESIAAGDAVSQFAAWMRSDWRAPCPACGAPWTSTPAGRIVIVHRHARHRELRLPCIMACDEATCIPVGVPAVRERPAPLAPPAPDPDRALEAAAIASEDDA